MQEPIDDIDYLSYCDQQELNAYPDIHMDNDRIIYSVSADYKMLFRKDGHTFMHWCQTRTLAEKRQILFAFNRRYHGLTTIFTGLRATSLFKHLSPSTFAPVLPPLP